MSVAVFGTDEDTNDKMSVSINKLVYMMYTCNSTNTDSNNAFVYALFLEAKSKTSKSETVDSFPNFLLF